MKKKQVYQLRGIVLLNPNFTIGNLHKSESLAIQKIATERFIQEHGISHVILNPLQLYPYYTIPHVLLYNLRSKQAGQLDCLVLYSLETVERFIQIYPEKWLELSDYFHDIFSVSDQSHSFEKRNQAN